MSCSGETIEEENELIQIKPGIIKQLKKAKYGVVDHSTVELCHYTKKSFKDDTEFLLIDVWNFHQQACIAKIGVYIVGDLWSFTNQ